MARKGAMVKPPPVRGEERKRVQAQNRGQQATPSPDQQTQANGATGPSKWTRTGPGTYKDQYGNVLRGQQKAPKRDMSQRGKQTQPTGAIQPTPQEITEQGFRGAADLYGGMMERFKGFDPLQMQAQYQPVYSQEMERARQNVMGQFERRNAEEFARQQEDVQRQIVERGLDPSSPAAQALYKQLNVRQDLARQEALSAAEQAAQGIQQQMFGQAMGTAQMPYDIYGSTFAPAYMAGVGAQYQQQQLTQQQQFEAQQAKLNRQAQERVARMSRGGGGGGGGMSLYDRMEAEALARGYGQQPQLNPWAAGAQGLAQGVGAGITNWALK